MADRHICPVCETESGTITIHDNLYICGENDCGVHWSPQADDPDPWYPIRYAIGFCPRCAADVRDGGMDTEPTGFDCPECGYRWFDPRLDGISLALQLDHAMTTDAFPESPRRARLYY